jgi:hypothetical protein
MAVALPRPRPGHPAPQNRTIPSRIAAPERHLSRGATWDRPCPPQNKDWRPGKRTSPAASASSRRVLPSPLSSLPVCPAPPVGTQTRPPLPCSALAGLPPSSTRGPLPDWAFEPPGGPRLAPVTTPAATALPRLDVAFTRPLTSLAGTACGPTAVCLRLPPEHSFRLQEAISPGRTQKHPVTPQRSVVAFRHRLRTDSLASRSRPFMVELFAVGCFARTPSTVAARSPLSPGRELPTPARSNEPLVGPDPLDGICTRFVLHRPGSLRLKEAGPVPVAPARDRDRASDRMLGLGPCESQGVYSNKPPSSTDKHVAMHPALRDGSAAEG